MYTLSFKVGEKAISIELKNKKVAVEVRRQLVQQGINTKLMLVKMID